MEPIEVIDKFKNQLLLVNFSWSEKPLSVKSEVNTLNNIVYNKRGSFSRAGNNCKRAVEQMFLTYEKTKVTFFLRELISAIEHNNELYSFWSGEDKHNLSFYVINNVCNHILEDSIKAFRGNKQETETKLMNLKFPNLFTDYTAIQDILDKLESNSFVIKNENKEYIWQGHPIDKKAKKIQLVALSMKLNKHYNKAYTDKEIHHVFTQFFNIKTAYQIFKDSQSGEALKHMRYFNFI